MTIKLINILLSNHFFECLEGFSLPLPCIEAEAIFQKRGSVCLPVCTAVWAFGLIFVVKTTAVRASYLDHFTDDLLFSCHWLDRLRSRRHLIESPASSYHSPKEENGEPDAEREYDAEENPEH
jgi:hypothetical protein